MRHLRRRERITGYVISRPCRHKRIHDRKIDGIGVALIEARAQYDGGSDQLSAVVPLVFARRGAFCIIASKCDGQFQTGIGSIKMPMIASRVMTEEMMLTGLTPIAQ